MASKKQYYSTRETTEASLPQVWGKNPIFAAIRLNEPRSVALSDGTMWTMGVQPPFGDILPEYKRGLDVRHAEVIFRLLSFYRENDIDFAHRVDLSYYKLLEIIGWTKSKNALALLKDVLADLTNIWTQISTQQKQAFTFRILSTSVDAILDAPDNGRLRFIAFDPTFLEFLNSIEDFFSIRLDIFEGIKGKIAKAAYLYLPSRALKSTKKAPFKITLSRFFDQIGIQTPKYKSQRLQKMTRRSNPLKELNNKLITFREKLCVCLEETKDKKDYNLCVWTEPTSDSDICWERENSLRTWFLNGNNGTVTEYQNKMKNLKILNSYEISALELSGIDLDKSMNFLQTSKTLLGEVCFGELCGTVKNAVLEDKVKSATAYFITLVKSELLNELPFVDCGS